ncbi:MAG TPA: S-ribosylhomocysteine lyase, partial [Clostridiales bacterium]|nr:S-ribosylhomocysteine lyase [Clostridiales bacterium]
TGFYLLTAGLDYEEVYTLLKSSLALALTFTEVPGNKREECGNYLEHDLGGAIDECKNYLRILKEND